MGGCLAHVFKLRQMQSPQGDQQHLSSNLLHSCSGTIALTLNVHEKTSHTGHRGDFLDLSYVYLKKV